MIFYLNHFSFYGIVISRLGLAFYSQFLILFFLLFPSFFVQAEPLENKPSRGFVFLEYRLPPLSLDVFSAWRGHLITFCAAQLGILGLYIAALRNIPSLIFRLGWVNGHPVYWEGLASFIDILLLLSLTLS